MKTKSLLPRYGSISMLLALAACGGSDENASDNSAPGATYSPTTAPLGNFNVKCDKSPGQQVQQQSPYQQQQQQSSGSCTPQFEFYSAVVTNFDVDLDCRNNRVLVTGKGVDQSSAAIPIQGDGSWKGQVTVNQSVANDGQGNVFCKVKTIVNFDGNASCSQGSEGLNWGTTVNFAQSSGAGSAALTSLNSTSRFSNDMPGIAASTPLASDPMSGDPLAGDPLAQPSVLPTPVASSTNGSDAGAGVEAGIASPTPSASPSVCSFSSPQSVNSQALKIDIPAGAGDLGCNAYGAGAYQIFAGTQVTWINHDTQPHTVTADSDSGDSFDSGAIQPGQSFTHVFSAVGSFRYHSTLDSNMQGLIVVQVAPVSPTPSPTQTASPIVSPSPTSTAGGGGGGPIIIPPITPTSNPGVSPTPSASPSPSPSVSPSASPSPSPSASPSPSPSVSPGTSPSPSVTQIVSCVVVNPCPIFAQTTQKCPVPAQQ